MVLAGLAERELVRHRGDDLDLGVDREQLLDALSHDQAVLSYRNPDRHSGEPNRDVAAAGGIGERRVCTPPRKVGSTHAVTSVAKMVR